MEYIKKNWTKILLILALIGGVVFSGMIVLQGIVCDASLAANVEAQNSLANSSFLMAIAQLVFFVATTIFVLLKNTEKNRAGLFVMLSLSCVALVLTVVSLFVGIEYADFVRTQIELLPATAAKSSTDLLNAGIFSNVINMITFGLLPFIFSIKKLFTK